MTVAERVELAHQMNIGAPRLRIIREWPNGCVFVPPTFWFADPENARYLLRERTLADRRRRKSATLTPDSLSMRKQRLLNEMKRDTVET